MSVVCCLSTHISTRIRSHMVGTPDVAVIPPTLCLLGCLHSCAAVAANSTTWSTDSSAGTQTLMHTPHGGHGFVVDVVDFSLLLDASVHNPCGASSRGLHNPPLSHLACMMLLLVVSSQGFFISCPHNSITLTGSVLIHSFINSFHAFRCQFLFFFSFFITIHSIYLWL